MKEAATTNPVAEDGGPSIVIFQVIAVSLLFLNLFTAIVILLIPLGIFRSRGVFLGSPGNSLWLLFIFSLIFGLILFGLGSPKHLNRALLTRGGTTFLFLGIVSALEILLIKAYSPGTRTNSLWWLFVTVTVLGAIGVYLPVRLERLKAKEARRKAEEAKLRALAKERRTSPTVFRFRVRRYYVCEEKLLSAKTKTAYSWRSVH
jgi:hypothetical protein